MSVPSFWRELWLRIMSRVLGWSGMSTDHVEGVDINMGDRAPVVCVVTIYHKLGGGVLRSVLESIERLRYP